jgi:hypothetical protein
MPHGYVLTKKEIVRTGKERKVRLTEKEIARFKESPDLRSMVALVSKKLRVTPKLPVVGIFGIDAPSKRKSTAKPSGKELVFKQGDSWLSIQDDDGNYYTFDWGNSECCESPCGGPCE